jgi:hypothetical protein
MLIINALAGFLLLLQLASLRANESAWQNYPLSSEEVANFLGEILSSGSEITSPSFQVCQKSKIAELCTEKRVKKLEELNQQQKEISPAWIKEIEESDELRDAKKNCVKESTEISSRFEDANQKFQQALNLHKTNSSALKLDLEKMMSAQNINEPEFVGEWTRFCEGSTRPHGNSIAEYLFIMMLESKREEDTKKGKLFCENLKSKNYSWLKNEIIESGISYLDSLIKDSGEVLIKRKFRDKFFEFNLRSHRPFNVYIPKKDISQLKTKLNGKECSELSISEDIEDQVCFCLESKIQSELIKKETKKYGKMKAKLQTMLDSIYSEMIQKSHLSGDEKEMILTKYPPPRLHLDLSKSAFGSLYYVYDTPTIPYKDKISISPGVMKELLKPSSVEMGDLALSAITHEVGHHFFTSLMAEVRMYEELSSQSKAKLREFSECLDQVTYKKEMISAFRDEIETNPRYIQEIVPSKRVELAADFYAIAFNKVNSLGKAWKPEHATLYHCTILKKLSDSEEKIEILEGSHTSPEARANILLNPPACHQLMWSK